MSAAESNQPGSGDDVSHSGDTRILDGIRVIDCSEGIAGPVASMMLAEAGADVIKVEQPGGDPSRASEGFRTWNRSKRSVVLDLHDEAGRDQLHHLLAEADVFVHGFGPAMATELGLTDDELVGRHPQLITCGRPVIPVPTVPSTTFWSVPGSGCATSSAGIGTDPCSSGSPSAAGARSTSPPSGSSPG
jgi:hypothetical protein